MDFLDDLSEILFWVLPIYIVSTIVLTILFWTCKRENEKCHQYIRKAIGIVNVIFILCFAYLTFYDMAVTKRRYGVLSLDNSYNTSDWSMIISSILFLILLFFRKLRESPYTLIVISTFILINLLIAFSTVAIVV